MDGQRRRFGEKKENGRELNYPRGRQRQKTKDCRHRRHQNVNCERHFSRDMQAAQQASTSETNETRVLEIPGFTYDPVKKRYFKNKQGEPLHFGMQNETKCEDVIKKPRCKTLSRLQYLQKRETNILQNNLHFQRKGLEDWARNIAERKSFVLSDTHPCPAFKGSLSNLALSHHCGRLVTIAKLPGLGCNTIHIYDVKNDKMEWISPHMLATVIASEVTHVEWNPNENMKNYFLLNLFGSEDAKGTAIVCNFNESLQSCELNSYPLPNGTAWHCSWSKNPQFSSLLGIAGSQQAVLVDSVKKSMICKIRSSSDIFCIEFSHKSPVAYLGCRNGNVMCVDIRGKHSKQNKPFIVTEKVRSSATCIKVMQDENYLMTSSIDGLIKMWDVRLSKSVKEYVGNSNETKLIPFVMDSSENIMASAGDDGKTRIWSIQTCEQLKTIDPANNSSDKIDIPPICLGENWALTNNMMALGLGTEDKLMLYF